MARRVHEETLHERVCTDILAPKKVLGLQPRPRIAGVPSGLESPKSLSEISTQIDLEAGDCFQIVSDTSWTPKLGPEGPAPANSLGDSSGIAGRQWSCNFGCFSGSPFAQQPFLG